ncbi:MULTISPECIES: MurR/RpiR family transcriptional regulator [Rhizobium]|uniref:MurR/RpiR family transcriptional regulator n=1 Tax=Rhizobium tropici TaxID=398 RepID=A0A329YMV9_RHITR|nr:MULTISPECIES: MurR/RpiR family transcriptional regulator [Rhizobium]MBB3287835.1 DNA-binding MurR/RpiR family transcriptional regulator [Rhizobium sp. BK252]MBB3402561.1 DNA-binding MurR/RpiR family transcriptional regulator [Rhizobium sp. BK289]MBB3415137.1 DNA-binding MurR/RpiR family transcriptional regulator [Rhizobium sp. BK284]MBB3483026.1 DNA-binding MurR/RpiR family transcriptional regulator [Rhizobium sp. BK347]MDK4720651.1 MurR/RpiR family transcriptional regulator [Rhizobium sp. 
MAEATQKPRTFEDRVLDVIETLAPSEQRIARFFVDQKQAALLNSAAQIAQLAGTSDATVVRTARALGFESLSTLRAALLEELTGAPSPGTRMQRTLAETGSQASDVLHHVISIHEQALEVLRREEFAASFERCVDSLAKAARRHVFGIGPSGAIADYTSLQFNRIGLPSSALSASGIALADRLLGISKGDVVLVMAYAPLYREVEVLLEYAGKHGAPIILISDDLGLQIADKVTEVLPVPRGNAGHLAMHAGTLVLIESLIVALAAKGKDAAIDRLDQLSQLRGALDKSWSKRGTRKRK